MPFKNRIRLPFYVTRPQFPREANIFRRADGSTKVQSVIIRMVFEGETDNLPKAIHERFIIALSHDDVTVEGRYYLGGVSLEGDYDIDWNKFLDYPLAKSAFKVQVTPFNYSNDNCKTCEEVSQVVCEDDDIGILNEDETVTVHPLDNDSICCKPVVISLVTYNTDYLDSCVISGNDIVIHTKASLSDANNVTLVTYRAQCPNGSYDEANIIGNINGTDPTPVCLAPTSLNITDVTDTTVDFAWGAPSPVPDCGYHWEVYQGVTLVTSGDTSGTTAQVTGLTASTSYVINVASNCCSLTSNFLSQSFTTDPPVNTNTCGQYQIYNANNVLFTNHVSYLDCNGDQQNIAIRGGQTKFICALQSNHGDPTQIIPDNNTVQISYVGLC